MILPVIRVCVRVNYGIFEILFVNRLESISVCEITWWSSYECKNSTIIQIASKSGSWLEFVLKD